MSHQMYNGNLIPLIGLGTFKLRCNVDKSMVYNTLDTAITKGYRLIDTASCYRNEKDIGDALTRLYVKHNIDRSSMFITTKIAPKDLCYEDATTSCMQSLKDLQMDYLDLCLIHWPGRSKLPPDDAKHKVYRKEAWLALEDLWKKGVVRNIGVSNYTLDHLNELMEYAEIRPSVLQVEFHPHLYQKHLMKYCVANQIFLQAYSSLATGILLLCEDVQTIALKYNTSAAQLLLKWAVQRNIGVIPKSCTASRINSNYELDAFTLAADDMSLIDALNIDKHYCWDPTQIK